MSDALVPDIDPVSAPYWSELAAGRLSFQACDCGHRWLPARESCPSCLGTSWRRETARGRARLVSWVVFHTAHHPSFANRLPYNVAVVELEEGPRLISNVLADHAALRGDAPLRLVIDTGESVPLPRFELDQRSVPPTNHKQEQEET